MNSTTSTLFLLDGILWGYVAGIALLVWEPFRRLRQWPQNRRVRRENELYVPAPLPAPWERAFRELAKANLSGANLQGATLAGADLRLR